MQYAQLNEDGTFFKQCESGNIKWDENNFCSAEALFIDGKADMFRVVEFHEAPAPIYDPATQVAVFEGGEYVDGRWQYKWRVDNLSPEQVAEKIAAQQEALFRDIQNQTQKRLNVFAQTRLYSGMLSLCTYATSTNTKFQVEGQYGVEARDATWTKLYEILGEIQAGARPAPSSFSEIEPELPVLQWPE